MNEIFAISKLWHIQAVFVIVNLFHSFQKWNRFFNSVEFHIYENIQTTIKRIKPQDWKHCRKHSSLHKLRTKLSQFFDFLLVACWHLLWRIFYTYCKKIITSQLLLNTHDIIFELWNLFHDVKLWLLDSSNSHFFLNKGLFFHLPN